MNSVEGILTFNTGDFTGFPGLRVIDPAAV